MTQTNDAYSRNSVRAALKGWHQPKLLAAHPLAQTRVVEQRLRQERRSFSDSPSARGLALRNVLREAIEALRPDDATPDFNNPQWRYYLILYRQYIKEQQAAQIQDLMGISESGYFKDQRRALDRLAGLLRERAAITGAATAGDPPAEPPARPLFNVPLQPTPFIGRAQELAQIHALLAESACRLLVLLGPGGIGKTRLALEVATQSAAGFAHGVAFVPLAPLRHSDLLASALCAAVQVGLASDADALAVLSQFLQHRQMLLVLDNFEQLIDGASVVRHLLDHCPALKLLVTSRFRLDLLGEWTLEIGGLELPTAADDPDFEHYPGIRLFWEAMRRVQPSAVLQPADRPCVLTLCRTLEGMPLGIELAASWLPLLPCGEIVAEIGRNIDFLATPLRDLPERHRSLRGVFNHTWELLSGPERQAIQRLAVFAGSFTREAAQEVAYANLLLLRALRNKSMLRVDDSGRYTVQELLRQYAEEKLRADSAEWQTTRDRHAGYYLGYLAERGAQLRGGSNQLRARRQLLPELDNIRAAWEWIVARHEAALGRDAALALFLLYDLLNRAREGQAAFALAAAAPWPSAGPAGQECALLTLVLRGYFEARMGDVPAAQATLGATLAAAQTGSAAEVRALVHLICLLANVPLPSFDLVARYETALAFFSAAGDVWGQARIELAYGMLLRRVDEPGSKQIAQAAIQRSLTLHETLPDLWGISKCLNYLGHIAYESGDYDAAERHGRRSLELFQEMGDRLGMAYAFYSLGQVLGTRGDYAAAQKFYGDGLQIYRELGNAHELADGLDSLGYVTYLRGEYETAEAYYRESLQISRTLRDQSGIGWSLHNLGDLARARGDLAAAQRLYKESHDMHLADHPFGWGRIVALDKLGRVSMAAGDWAAARRFHLRALHLAVQTNRPREATDALWALAQGVLDRSPGADAQEQAALVWLTLIAAHPATAEDTRRLADARRAALAAHLTAPIAAPLEARGAALTLGALLAQEPLFGPGQPEGEAAEPLLG